MSVRRGVGKSYFINKLRDKLESFPLFERPQYIFEELPPLLYTLAPTALVKQADLTLVVTDASMTWKPVDKNVLTTYLSGITHPAGLLLNRAQYDELEDVVGDLSDKDGDSSKKSNSKLVPEY
ncbi:hypothetical protein [Spirosoma foliorum]|uniref:Uncharacterized protein n=1 Tax=Spirosoma foliorum TaxID=2710596 RepID=A0A7G5H3Z7_9BACT|nr:hypothetical protein [Spirosoma foliorum]QMW05839.1 hypothetical protein H3H32_13545 [Spirosoma foliorum]